MSTRGVRRIARRKTCPIHIEHQTLDTTIEKSGNLIGQATTTFISQVDGLRVVPFDFFPKLRVQSVALQGGQQIGFVQEGKDEDAEYLSVILPKPLAAGEKCTIVTKYEGKDAVSNEGGGNYFPVARENWYPSVPAASFGEYTSYDLTFRIPKGMKMAATGSLVSESEDGDHNVTVWKSDVPQTVAGFNFGKLKMQEAKTNNPVYLSKSYANEQSPNWVEALRQQATTSDLLNQEHFGTQREVALGTMSTTGLEKKALAEGQLSLVLYSDYFGPASVQAPRHDPANRLQLWTVLAELGVAAVVFLFRRNGAPSVGSRFRRLRILENSRAP